MLEPAWRTFVSQLVVKLEELDLSADFHPGSSSPLAKFKNLVKKLQEIKAAKALMTQAESINQELLKTAGIEAVKNRIKDLQVQAQNALSDIFKDWGTAKACATALVRHLTGEVSKQGAIDNQPPMRYQIEITVSPTPSSLGLWEKIRKNIEKAGEDFRSDIEIELVSCMSDFRKVCLIVNVIGQQISLIHFVWAIKGTVIKNEVRLYRVNLFLAPASKGEFSWPKDGAALDQA